MMQHTFCHSLKQQQPGLGLSAYWSMFANENSDRTPEIKVGSIGGGSGD